MVVLRIDHLPDLSRSEYQLRYGKRAIGLAEASLSDVLKLIPPDSGEWAGVRYVFDPTAGPRKRLTIFLVVSDEQPGNPETTYLGKHSIERFFDPKISSIAEASASVGSLRTVCLVRQGEETVPSSEGPLTYAPVVFETKDADVTEATAQLDDALDQVSGPVVADLLVRPVSMGPSMVAALAAEQRFLSRLASAFSPERRQTGSIDDLSRIRDPIAGRHQKMLEGVLERVTAGDTFEFVFRVGAAHTQEGRLVAQTLASQLGTFASIDVFELDPDSEEHHSALETIERFGFDQVEASSAAGMHQSCGITSDEFDSLCVDDIARGRRLAEVSRLRSVCDWNGAQRILRLPLSTGTSMRTIPLETEVGRYEPVSGDDSDCIEIGFDLERAHKVKLELDQMLKHTLMVGGSGSGKSNTGRRIVFETWERPRIPVLVLESAKGEYRQLIQASESFGESMRILTAGDDRISPFRFNPLEVPNGFSVEEHIALLHECFLGALPINEGPLPAILLISLRRTYENHDLAEWMMGEKCQSFPTMDDLLASVEEVVAERNYSSEIQSNVQAATETRLQPLCELAVGRMFRTERTNPPLGSLLAVPTVIEMQRLTGEQKNLTSLFILSIVNRMVRNRGLSDRLRLLVVIEEAHNLAGAVQASSTEGGNAKGPATELLVNLAAEIRAYGVGLVFIDQSPESIASDIRNNVTTKVNHRINSSKDVEAVTGAMPSAGTSEEELFRLRPGEAFIFNERMYRPARIQVNRLEVEGAFLSDEALLGHLRLKPWFADLWLSRVRAENAQLINGLRSLLSVQQERARRRPDQWTEEDRNRLSKTVNEGVGRIRHRLRQARAALGPSGPVSDLTQAIESAVEDLLVEASAGFASLGQTGPNG